MCLARHSLAAIRNQPSDLTSKSRNLKLDIIFGSELCWVVVVDDWLSVLFVFVVVKSMWSSVTPAPKSNKYFAQTRPSTIVHNTWVSTNDHTNQSTMHMNNHATSNIFISWTQNQFYHLPFCRLIIQSTVSFSHSSFLPYLTHEQPHLSTSHEHATTKFNRTHVNNYFQKPLLKLISSHG